MKISITVTRLEGPTHLCDIPHTRESFAEAKTLLESWRVWAPPYGQGYDKCRFVIEGDLEYTGRYDLNRDRPITLKSQVVNFIKENGYPELAEEVSKCP